MTSQVASNKSIDRTLYLLEVLATKGTPLNIAEVSKLLSVNRITAQSLLHSLEARNYIERDPETGKYSLGYAMFELGDMYRHQFPFLYAAEKHIAAAHLRTKSKINLVVLKPRGIVIILMSKDSSVIPHMVHGRIIPAYASACGKLLLANLEENELEEILEQIEFKKFTENTLVDKKEFRKELEKIRQNGYSIEMEELVRHRACIAAPIRNITGKIIAGVSFSDAKDHVVEHMDEMIQDIVLLGRSISSELGYKYLIA